MACIFTKERNMIFERKLGIYFDTKKIFLTAIFNNDSSEEILAVTSVSLEHQCLWWLVSDTCQRWLSCDCFWTIRTSCYSLGLQWFAEYLGLALVFVWSGRRGLICIFQEFSSTISKAFILTGGLVAGLTFYGV